jgi:hypothetical protein
MGYSSGVNQGYGGFMAHRTGFARVTALVTLALALLGAASLAQEMSVPYTYDDGTAGTLRCLFSSLVLPDQARVSIHLDEPSAEISRDEPFYVAHGFGGGLSPDFLATLDSQGLVAFLLQHARFELNVNGKNFSPNYINVDPASASITGDGARSCNHALISRDCSHGARPRSEYPRQES